jgi:hypothetical protein
MSFTRALSRQISRVLIGVLLFAQFAVASYACPGLSTMPAMAASDAVAMSPDCDQIDRDAANLCAEHCRHGQQSADTASAPVVLAPVPTLLYWLPLELEPPLGSARALPAPDPVLAVRSPPHSILHCVYRI